MPRGPGNCVAGYAFGRKTVIVMRERKGATCEKLQDTEIVLRNNEPVAMWCGVA
jgi:hypothetical protein